ncbi:hypothetical protein QTP86_022036 [Hemibagrus guttatus]|nr:hypothetical protein QTP86_022036 [Hemibagrus guttatus]
MIELQERVSDIEGERNILKRSYNALLLRTLSGHSHHDEHECDKESERQEMGNCRAEMVVLKKKPENEKSERELKQEKKRVVQDYETSQMERAQEMAMTTTLREKHDFLEQEVLQHRQNATSLQERLDRVSKDFQTDVEDLSEILMQIKAFRLQQESCKGLTFLVSNEKVKDPSQELAAQQVSHVETILELQKTRELLVMQQRINSDLQGCRLKIEILSLLFDPSSSVALDQSVQQVYVEYRLLGIPRETTETPMSLQKPTEGEEIHFNFSRVIHVDSMNAAPLKQYLYTKLEKTDAKQGRLKFSVVSEPLNEEDECVDVGHAYLDLQELLLTGNDVTECQIDIVRMDGDQEVVGRLKVSLEAAQALKGIS